MISPVSQRLKLRVCRDERKMGPAQCCIRRTFQRRLAARCLSHFSAGLRLTRPVMKRDEKWDRHQSGESRGNSRIQSTAPLSSQSHFSHNWTTLRVVTFRNVTRLGESCNNSSTGCASRCWVPLDTEPETASGCNAGRCPLRWEVRWHDGQRTRSQGREQTDSAAAAFSDALYPRISS